MTFIGIETDFCKSILGFSLTDRRRQPSSSGMSIVLKDKKNIINKLIEQNAKIKNK